MAKKIQVGAHLNVAEFEVWKQLQARIEAETGLKSRAACLRWLIADSATSSNANALKTQLAEAQLAEAHARNDRLEAALDEQVERIAELKLELAQLGSYRDRWLQEREDIRTHSVQWHAEATSVGLEDFDDYLARQPRVSWAQSLKQGMSDSDKFWAKAAGACATLGFVATMLSACL